MALKKIAICGKKNVGKNTLSQLICQEMEHRRRFDSEIFLYDILAFADPIKEMILLMFPQAKRECLFGSSELRENIIPDALNQDGKPLTYRQALIDLGTLGRKYNPCIWVQTFEDRVKKIRSGYSTDLIICSDLRFMEELEYLKANNFTLIKLLRHSVSKLDNATETVQDGIPNSQFNFIVENNGTIEDLQHKAFEIVSSL